MSCLTFGKTDDFCWRFHVELPGSTVLEALLKVAHLHSMQLSVVGSLKYSYDSLQQSSKSWYNHLRFFEVRNTGVWHTSPWRSSYGVYIYIWSRFAVRYHPPPRGREKLGLFRVLPKTPFSSQMLKVLSQLHHHHHHLFLSHPCNPSQTFHDFFISTSQPSCSCMIPPWVLILFSIPLSSMLALFHSHCLTET